jgi:hypothetical protein
LATLHIEHPISDLKTWLGAEAFKSFLETTVWANAEASPALDGTPTARILTDVDTTS